MITLIEVDYNISKESTNKMEPKKRFPHVQPHLVIISFGIALTSFFQPSNCSNQRGFQGMFVFGSSVVDNGNNNHLLLPMAKCNFRPYGIDYPSGPTGRFSNGKNIADLIGDGLGLPPIPAFAESKGKSLVHGVNYGSGGSGILDTTGFFLVQSLNKQIQEFKFGTLRELEKAVKAKREEILPKYLFMIAAGNNDYGLNYFFIKNATKISPEAFTKLLISSYSDQLKSLYDLGARNFLLVSVYPLGCNPWIKDYTKTTRGCHQPSNDATRLFHTHLINLVDELKPRLPGSEFLVMDSCTLITDVINNPRPYGFDNVEGACCELKTNLANLKLACKENGNVCPIRSRYVFFDGQHNTQALNEILAFKAFNSNNKSEIYPINLRELAQRV